MANEPAAPTAPASVGVKRPPYRPPSTSTISAAIGMIFFAALPGVSVDGTLISAAALPTLCGTR